MSSRRHSRRVRNALTGIAVVLAVLVTGGVVAFAFARTAPSDTKAFGTFTPTPVKLQFVPHLQVIGDSFTEGSAEGGGGDKGWPNLIQQDIAKKGGRLGLTKTARGGSGYVKLGPSGQSFDQALGNDNMSNQDVVVVFGSINDQMQDPTAVQAAASKLYADIKVRDPKAILIVAGPPWMNDKPVPEIYRIRDAVKAAAVQAGAQFIDPLADGWFTGEAAKMIGTDKTHPNDDGHRYMADKLEGPITDALATVIAANK